jgi:hypothetical protein
MSISRFASLSDTRKCCISIKRNKVHVKRARSYLTNRRSYVRTRQFSIAFYSSVRSSTKLTIYVELFTIVIVSFLALS